METKAFIIGPIGDRDAPIAHPDRISYEESVQVMEHIIVPACESLGVETIRADQINRTGEIPEQIFRLLRDTQIVIADLTAANPNVMYELGLRHTTGKMTIQIGEKGRLPFDISAIRTILFRRTEGGLIDARRSLIQALATGLDSGGDHVSATRVWFENSPIAMELGPVSSQPETENAVSPDGPGTLELLADVEEGFFALTTSLSTSTSITSEITRIFQEGSEQFSALDARGGGNTERLAIANRLAARLLDPTSRLEVTAGEFAQSIQRLDPGMNYLFDIASTGAIGSNDVDLFMTNIRFLIDATETAMEGTRSFKDSLVSIESSTRSFRSIARRITATLQLMIDSSSRIIAWRSRLAF